MTVPRGQLILALVAQDRTFKRAQSPQSGTARGAADIWVGKCIHCRSALVVGAQGQVTPLVTLEHIVPKTAGGQDVPDNLALACARCNNQKGSRLDGKGLGDPRLARMIETLQQERARRARPIPKDMMLSEGARAWLAGAGHDSQGMPDA